MLITLRFTYNLMLFWPFRLSIFYAVRKNIGKSFAISQKLANFANSKAFLAFERATPKYLVL